MIPQGTDLLESEELMENHEVAPAKTYRIDFTNKRIIGMVDDRDAVLQFIRKVLNTDKYAYEIYDWFYGNDIYTMVGNPYDYVVTRLPNILKEALLVDDRIVDVRDCTFSKSSTDVLTISCVVDTVYGEIMYEQEVTV